MADHQPAADADQDFAEHEKTFAMFTSLVKWGSVTIGVILILMAMFLL